MEKHVSYWIVGGASEEQQLQNITLHSSTLFIEYVSNLGMGLQYK